MNEKEFKELFHLKYNPFCNYATVIVKDDAAAEDIVQEVFVDFWKRFGNKEVTFKPDHYVLRAVKFKCIDLLRKQSVHRNYVEETGYVSSEAGQEEPLNDSTDMSLVINLAVDKLPPKTKEVFVLCKIDKLSYKQTAQKLGISEKTVENQMLRAFKHLRVSLKEYEFLVLLIFIFFG